MQTLNIKVTQQAVILQNKDPVTAENVNQIRCVVELDPAYADLVVRVCMNGQFATVVDGQCFAPPLQEGMCRLGVYGYAMDGEQLVQRISPEPCVFYVRPGSYDPVAVETDAPDPTELESYYAKVQALLKDIGKGVNGTTYTPSVSVAGEISWTNDGGKDNPEPVNIKGPKGDTGAAGKDGVNGSDGAKGDKGDKGDPGEPGASGVETWETVFTKTFDEDTTANQQWNLTEPCRKIRLRMAVAGSAANATAGDHTIYINSYTSKCFLPNVFRSETDTAKGAFAIADVEMTGDMVRVQTNKSNIASNFNAASSMTGGSIWNASGITFNIFRDVEKHGAIKALSFPTNGKTIGAGTRIEILGVAK